VRLSRRDSQRRNCSNASIVLSAATSGHPTRHKIPRSTASIALPGLAPKRLLRNPLNHLGRTQRKITDQARLFRREFFLLTKKFRAVRHDFAQRGEPFRDPSLLHLQRIKPRQPSRLGIIQLQPIFPHPLRRRGKRSRCCGSPEPYWLIFLVPLLTAVLHLLYLKRRGFSIEYLVFSAHLQSVGFVLFSLELVLKIAIWVWSRRLFQRRIRRPSIPCHRAHPITSFRIARDQLETGIRQQMANRYRGRHHFKRALPLPYAKLRRRLQLLTESPRVISSRPLPAATPQSSAPRNRSMIQIGRRFSRRLKKRYTAPTAIAHPFPSMT
jgi:hypothetical protein